jgi:carbonic anhydrase
MVFVTPVQLSAEQIEAFRAVLKGNSRPTQSLNGRKVGRLEMKERIAAP